MTTHSTIAASARVNRLAREKSPYLLQHQHNPVEWFAWGEEPFARAQRENKPVFLSIGYSTCHWCHVMERESFESETIAGFLNAHFVSIKVDREERPDVDKIYMTFVQATSGPCCYRKPTSPTRMSLTCRKYRTSFLRCQLLSTATFALGNYPPHRVCPRPPSQREIV